MLHDNWVHEVFRKSQSQECVNLIKSDSNSQKPKCSEHVTSFRSCSTFPFKPQFQNKRNDEIVEQNS